MTHLKPVDGKTPTWQRTTLLATDNSHSIIGEIIDGKHNPIAYTAYGEHSAQQQDRPRLGFNGQVREAKVGWYLLGNGYRAYNPRLMRFQSPDSWSPFGGGGLNAYMYCVGDPINRSDPTGHVGGLKHLFTSIKEGGFGPGARQPLNLANFNASGALSMLSAATRKRINYVEPPRSTSFLSELGSHLDSLPAWRRRPDTASLPEQSGHGVGGKWRIAMAAPQLTTRGGVDNSSSRFFQTAQGSIEAPLPPSGNTWTSDGGVHGRDVIFGRVRGGGSSSTGPDVRPHTSPAGSNPTHTQYRVGGNNPLTDGWREDTSPSGYRNIHIRVQRQRYPTINNPNAPASSASAIRRYSQ